jgi:hypothetical protein
VTVTAPAGPSDAPAGAKRGASDAAGGTGPGGTTASSRRRGRILLVLGAIAIVVILAGLVIAGLSRSAAQTLGATSTTPSGAKALVEVLRRQGVAVDVTSTLEQTKRAAASSGTVTVFVSDDQEVLDEAQWRQLGALGRHTVVAAPGSTALKALAPGVRQDASGLSGTLAPSCDVAALARVRAVTGSGSGYTVHETPAGTTTTVCLPARGAAGAVYGLVEVERGGHATSILGASEALENGAISDHDNAAMALTLLGDSPTLVWYLPTIADLPKGQGTLGTLTPGWVTPSILLLVVATVAAAVWRGRRLGPLVVENLPVVVRATETVEGRARLYERGRSRGHALDQLRIGAIGRLASATGLGSRASVDDVVLRVAALLGVDPRRVHGTLVGGDPVDDRQLMAMSDDLANLELAVERATRPARPVRAEGEPRPSDPEPPPSKGTA